MKILIFLATAFFLFHAQAHASDVTITVTDAVTPPGNNGSITIDIDPAITSVPFTITITGPGGFSQVATIFTNSLTITGLTPGIYCINVLNAEGCETNSCVEVRNCYLQERGGMDFYLCNSKPETCCDETALFMLGNPTQFNDAGVPTAFEFGTQHDLTIETINAILDTVYSLTMGEVDQIVSTGHSENEIPEQSEVESDAMFILKFNPEGELIWVYHNYQMPDFFGRNQIFDAPNVASSLSSPSFSLFPNPASETISLQLNALKNEEVVCRIFDIVGKTLHYELKSIKTGFNQIDFNLKDLPAGMVFFELTHADKTIATRKFIVQRD